MNSKRYERICEMLARRQPDLTVCMEQVHKPHNVSAIVRTADAVGVHEVHAVWPGHRMRTMVSAAAGSNSWVSVKSHQTIGDAVSHLKGRGMQILATNLSAKAVDFREIDYTRPTCILMGQEKTGISQEALDLADRDIIIPMIGMVQSLNVSVASALILYEAQRQRQNAGMYERSNSMLPEDEQQRLLVANTEKRLDEIRVTVDEKLQKTLNDRIGQSFRLVTEQLESVQKGLGEMQTLAQDVGGLKRVLSNVKTRGNIGEIQLSMLLEQILAPEQYEANVHTRKGSDAVVEFAVKLPGRDDVREFVYLPIDAKFPKDVYEQLLDAYDHADTQAIEAAGKLLETTIKKMAKDISDKYLAPPATTDFGIMFLPFEGIYAEVVRRSSLLEELQRNYKVVVTGPTTLAAILNSLQMGFRTLAIQKHSGEVWTILGAVKKEFEKVGGMLEKAQKNLQTASGQIEEVLGTRTRVIQRKLKDVDTLSDREARAILPEIGPLTDEENENGLLKRDRFHIHTPSYFISFFSVPPSPGSFRADNTKRVSMPPEKKRLSTKR